MTVVLGRRLPPVFTHVEDRGVDSDPVEVPRQLLGDVSLAPRRQPDHADEVLHLHGALPRHGRLAVAPVGSGVLRPRRSVARPVVGGVVGGCSAGSVVQRVRPAERGGRGERGHLGGKKKAGDGRRETVGKGESSAPRNP